MFKHLCLALASAVAVASASETSDVHTLTGETFKDFIKEHELVLAEFYAPWCGHCKALAPEYEVAATALKEKNIPLVKVDCTEEGDLCKEYGVEGYPTIKVFRGLDDIAPYASPRKSGTIISYMTKQSLPSVTTVTAENLEEFKAMDSVSLLAYFAEDDTANRDAFQAVADKFRNDYLFGTTSDAALAKDAGVSLPAIVMYKDFDDGKDVYDGKFDEESITVFAKTSSTPLVGEVGPETYSTYMDAGIPLAYIFAETPEERKEFAEALKPIALKHKGALNLATIDATAFGAHGANLNLDTSKWPAFAIQNTVTNAKYPYDQEKKIVEKDIAQFVQDVLDGKVDPSVKSEPIPETQDGPVSIIVAHNYQDLVIDNDKDVLVEFYAPWCGHCKALAPKYDILGSVYAENPDFASKVTIAKVDATANDVPDEIQGFPTIKLFPAGAKDAPVEYSGSRTIEDLASFVHENGNHKVDAKAEAAKAAKGKTDGDVTAAPGSEQTAEAKAETEAEAEAEEKEEEKEEEKKDEKTPEKEEL